MLFRGLSSVNVLFFAWELWIKFQIISSMVILAWLYVVFYAWYFENLGLEFNFGSDFKVI